MTEQASDTNEQSVYSDHVKWYRDRYTSAKVWQDTLCRRFGCDALVKSDASVAITDVCTPYTFFPGITRKRTGSLV